MDFSLFYAKLIGFYCVIVGLGMLVNAKNIQPMILEFVQNKSLVFLSGVLSLLFGLTVVLTHHVWTGWPVIVTVIGYLAVVKGVVRIGFNEGFTRFTRKFAHGTPYYVMSLVVLVLGAVLLYFGYLHH